ncbi:hypothetical protein [Selenomonas sputigena]|nr:hypothetical protein [Selenomonas sputigena]UZE45050.1 hypothetical protein OL236_10750 [Selenomonas sputigena]
MEKTNPMPPPTMEIAEKIRRYYRRASKKSGAIVKNSQRTSDE